MEIQTQDKKQQLMAELMKLGAISIQEFGSIDVAIEKTKALNEALTNNSGLIRFMSDEKNIALAQKLIKPLGMLSGKK